MKIQQTENKKGCIIDAMNTQTHTKLALSLLTVCFLTACGGGGGGGAATPSTPSTPSVPSDTLVATVTASAGDYLPSIVEGKFSNDGAKYAVVAGWATGGALVPVKILKVTATASTDATASILGGEQLATTNVPLVADFNGDGIDDIFLPGFKDIPATNATSVVFLSRAGQTHQRVNLTDSVWVHGASAVDLDGDGDLDVVASNGQMWINDGAGAFTFRDYAYNVNNLIVGGRYMNGSGACAGDFNNTGHKQVVITDVGNDINGAPIADTIIFELNAQLQSVDYHALPVPILDRGTVTEVSHDVACRVADLNNDGKLDIVVFSRPLDTARNGQWTNEGRVQILLNQGNWVFTDVTDTALVGYPTNALVSYSAVIEDLNGDGKPDLWLNNFDATSGLANQAWLNNGSATFTRSLQSTIDGFGSSGPMLPLKVNNWTFVYSKKSGSGYTFYTSAQQYSFQ